MYTACHCVHSEQRDKYFYLNYEGGFVAGTYDFWWDPTHKKPFGAYISNFMAH